MSRDLLVQVERERRRYRSRARRVLRAIARGATPTDLRLDYVRHALKHSDDPTFVEILRRQASDSVLGDLGLEARASREGLLHAVDADVGPLLSPAALCGANARDWRIVPPERFDSSPSRCRRCLAAVRRRSPHYG